MFFVVFIFSLSSLFSSNFRTLPDSACHVPITYSSVINPDLLPKPSAEKFGLYGHLQNRVLVCHNSSLDLDFVVLRMQVLRNFSAESYQDSISVGNYERLHSVDIEICDPKPLFKRYFNSPDETIIACVSQEQWLIFLTKNGLFSVVELQKNEGKQQPNAYFELLHARCHSQHSLPKEIHALDLSEKNCNLTYNDSKKAFVFSYVSLLPLFLKIPDAKPNGEPNTLASGVDDSKVSQVSDDILGNDSESSLFSCQHSTLPGSPCQISTVYLSVASADLLPKPVAEKFLLDQKYRVLGCHNDSLNIDFVVERREVLRGNTSYQDEIFVGNQEQSYALEIRKYKEGFPKKRYFDSPDESIIACASEGQLLVLLSKNGLFSIVEIQKNKDERQNWVPFSLLKATSHAQGPLPKEIHDLDLNEKNCNLTYNDSEKAFVFSYVSLLPFHPPAPDTKFDVEPKVKGVNDLQNLGASNVKIGNNDIIGDSKVSQVPDSKIGTGGPKFPAIKKLLCIVLVMIILSFARKHIQAFFGHQGFDLGF